MFPAPFNYPERRPGAARISWPRLLGRLVIFLGLCLVLAGCEPPRAASLPVDHTLTNRDGTKLDVEILARSETEVQIRRKSDSQIFNFPIAELSEADQTFVQRYPVSALSVPGQENAQGPASQGKKEPAYIQSRLDQIARLKKDIEILQGEIDSGKLSSILARNNRERIQSKTKEIQEMEADIRVYRAERSDG